MTGSKLNVCVTLSLVALALMAGTTTGSWIVFALILAFALGISLGAEASAEAELARKSECMVLSSFWAGSRLVD
jgi:hypothetical protein